MSYVEEKIRANLIKALFFWVQLYILRFLALMPDCVWLITRRFTLTG